MARRFFVLCQVFNILPAAACVQFGLNAPGVVSIALNTTSSKRTKENVPMIQCPGTSRVLASHESIKACSNGLYFLARRISKLPISKNRERQTELSKP
ncbi:D-threo-aldose 1-dehydrogenase [Adhaeribacter pallidiroseus]|uniref:D-threo-aldose 1-dehydrogenase n=1 Tax=Adhaeribacter pallidiroseus TaxID=2072847 RepID=A0A369QPQ0_9BACT|nr:D-threo-aldose 1-dehydrogenase [Adhaeribacter pallidiroseus]